MTWIINVEHASLLNDGIYILATFYRVLIMTCQRALSGLHSFLILVAMCIHNMRRAVFTFVLAQGDWLTDSREKCSYPSQWCSNGRLSGAFPDFIKKRSNLFGTGWDPSTPDLASWLVICCHYSSISKRQLSERSQEGLWFSFFLHVWTGRYKGSREHVAGSRPGSSKFECTNDLKHRT